MLNQNEEIEAERYKLFSLFCYPRLIIDTKRSIVVSCEYVWRNEDAKRLFDHLGKIAAENLARSFEMRARLSNA